MIAPLEPRLLADKVNSVNEKTDLVTLGWREWVSLPGLGVEAIKAKVDTVRSNVLPFMPSNWSHFPRKEKPRIRFRIHPLQKDQTTIATCTADILDKRVVTDSGGHREERFVISTELVIGGYCWPMEATLTARDNMLVSYAHRSHSTEWSCVRQPGAFIPRWQKTASKERLKRMAINKTIIYR